MKNLKKLFTITGTVLCMVEAVFAQSSKQQFSQKAASQGTVVGKAMRSCFGGNNSKAKVLAVVNRADWCAICQKNADRVEALLVDYKTRPIAFVPNDLTDARSKAVSAKYLRKLHVQEAVEPITESGVIILLNGKTHELVGKISLAASNDDIEKAFDSALSN